MISITNNTHTKIYYYPLSKKKKKKSNYLSVVKDGSNG